MDAGQPDIVAELLTLNHVPVAGRPGIPVILCDIPGAVVRIAMVMTDCDPPVEVRLSHQMFRSMCYYMLNLWLVVVLISRMLIDVVMQDIRQIKRNVFDLRSIPLMCIWESVRILDRIPNLMLKVRRKRDRNVWLLLMVLAIPKMISNHRIVKVVIGNVIPFMVFNPGPSEPTAERIVREIPAWAAFVVRHFVGV